jgi:uncharacterized protein YqeY
MTLKQRLSDDMKTAMRAKDQLRLEVLRMARADILNAEKSGDAQHELTDDEITSRLGTLIKQRRDSAEQFDKGGRAELAAKERAEIEVLLEYLPPAMSDAEIAAIVDEVIAATGAASAKEMGRVMGQTMARLKSSGKTVDGGAVQRIVKERLAG